MVNCLVAAAAIRPAPAAAPERRVQAEIAGERTRLGRRRSPVFTRRPFRHADAIASRALTRHHIGNGEYVPLFPGVSVAAGAFVTMAPRAAGAVLARPRGVVAGLAAAAVWGLDVAPADVTVDLLVDERGVRSCPGVRLRRGRLRDGETTVVDGTRVTTPARTALDLARWLPQGEAVVVVDALLRATGTDLAAVRAAAADHAGERDVGRADEALAWVDPRSPSPRGSRLRVGLLARGLEVPLVAQRLLDGEGRRVAELALAWPGVRLGAAHRPGVRDAAAVVGWEVLEVREDVAELWGTRTAPAPVDILATELRRAADRWDPAPRVGGRTRRSCRAPRARTGCATEVSVGSCPSEQWNRGERSAVSDERTLVLVKPDGVQRGLIGEVITRIERKGLRLASLELKTVDRSLAEQHYAEHAERPFFGELIEFITSGQVAAMIVEGPRAIAAFRQIAGGTDPVEKAVPGSLRGDLALETGSNIVHGSDSAESAEREIKLWFG